MQESYGAFKACRMVNACSALILDIDIDRLTILEGLVGAYKSKRPWLWLSSVEKVERSMPDEIKDVAASHRKWERRKCRALLTLSEALMKEDKRMKVMISVEDFSLVSDYYDEGEKI